MNDRYIRRGRRSCALLTGDIVNRAFLPPLAVAMGLMLVAARPAWSQMMADDVYGGMNGHAGHAGGYAGHPGGGYAGHPGGGYAGPEYGGMHGGPGCAGPDCAGAGMGCPDHCGLWDRCHSPSRMWLALEYTGLRLEGAAIPPLVTTSPVGTPQATAGVLPDAQVLFGNSDIADEWRHGAQVRLGWWLVDGQFLGVEGHYMALEGETTNDVFSSTFSTGAGSGVILARPFNDVTNGLPGVPGAQLIAFPAFQNGAFTYPLDGSISVAFDSDFQSAGAILRHVLWADFERCFRLDILGGYRFVNLDENLLIRGTRVHASAGGRPGDRHRDDRLVRHRQRISRRRDRSVVGVL